MPWPPDEEFLRFLQSLEPTGVITFDAKVVQDKNEGLLGSRLGAHCLIWAKTDAVLWDATPLKALVNMHIRFDGYLGFPGGLLDPGESVLEGVQRELQEEMSLALSLTAEDFVCKQSIQDPRNPGQHLHLYFFAREISHEAFIKMEKQAFDAKHYGLEILGNVRVPVHTYRNKDGLPRFLTHAMVGTAKLQLLLSLYKHNILSKEELLIAHHLHHQ